MTETYARASSFIALKSDFELRELRTFAESILDGQYWPKDLGMQTWCRDTLALMNAEIARRIPDPITWAELYSVRHRKTCAYLEKLPPSTRWTAGKNEDEEFPLTFDNRDDAEYWASVLGADVEQWMP